MSPVVGGTKAAIIGISVRVTRGPLKPGVGPDAAEWLWQANVTVEGGQTLNMHGTAPDRSHGISTAIQALDVLDALNRIGASSTEPQISAVRP